MRVKIFACHYRRPTRPLNGELFAPLLSGADDAEDGSFLGDLSGENISDRNEFSEIRHHYYVWKNLLGGLDHVGFEHYRRMFFINPMPRDRLLEVAPSFATMAEMFDVDQKLHELEQRSEDFLAHVALRESFGDADIDGFKRWLAHQDFVVPRMWHLHDRPDLEHEWKNGGLPPLMWDLMIEALGRQPSFQPMPGRPIRTSNHNSIFMMRSDLFDEYMRALFAAIEDLHGLMKGRVDDFPRMWGYVAEKALNYFILAKRRQRPFLSVAQMPLIVSTLTDDLA